MLSYHSEELHDKQFSFSCTAWVYVFVLINHNNFINQEEKNLKKVLPSMISISLKFNMVKANVYIRKPKKWLIRLTMSRTHVWEEHFKVWTLLKCWRDIAVGSLNVSGNR